MTSLFIIQLVCCTVTALLALQLAITSLQVRWRVRRYEVSRWLLCASMLLFTIHYLLQMIQGLRAQGADVGAEFNILFYTPVSFVVTLSIINIESTASKLRRYCLCSAIAYVVIVAVFVIGVLTSHSLHIGNLLYVMLALFVISMAYFIVVNRREMNRRRKRLMLNYGRDLALFERFSQVSNLMLCIAGGLLPLAILFNNIIKYAGPLMLLTIVIYTQTFISLGYYLTPNEEVEDEEEKCEADEETANAALTCKDSETTTTTLSESRRQEIEHALAKWCQERHYQDCNATIYSLATDINCKKSELTEYFNLSSYTNFRTWLSDIRFNEAVRMMKDFPQYSNDAISTECGFSSHTQIYRLFKQKAGLSPSQWRDQFV